MCVSTHTLIDWKWILLLLTFVDVVKTTAMKSYHYYKSIWFLLFASMILLSLLLSLVMWLDQWWWYSMNINNILPMRLVTYTCFCKCMSNLTTRIECFFGCWISFSFTEFVWFFSIESNILEWEKCFFRLTMFTTYLVSDFFQIDFRRFLDWFCKNNFFWKKS